MIAAITVNQGTRSCRQGETLRAEVVVRQSVLNAAAKQDSYSRDLQLRDG